jgi:anti-anti-sigma regulatory factor
MTDLLDVTITEGHVTILHFDGSLDRQTEDFVIENARAVRDSGARFLLIDLSNVDVITSAGLHAFHAIFKMFTPYEEVESWKKGNTGGVFKSPYFKLCGAPPQIQYVLNITGFLENIAIYPTLQEALDSFPS